MLNVKAGLHVRDHHRNRESGGVNRPEDLCGTRGTRL